LFVKWYIYCPTNEDPASIRNMSTPSFRTERLSTGRPSTIGADQWTKIGVSKNVHSQLTDIKKIEKCTMNDLMIIMIDM
jgi:hypothetical protein